MRLGDDFSEELMLTYARYASASQIERIVRGCRRCVAAEEGAERQFAEREFSWWHDDDGAVLFGGRLPAELGAIVVRALEAARDELGPPPPELAESLPWYLRDATVSPRARKADALVALAQTALAQKTSTADVYQVVVHVDADALDASAETPGRCTLEEGEPLPTAAARRLSCDASIVRVLERDGKTLSLGRKTRTIPPALRRALRMRDKTCTFPGCDRRYHLHGHHIEHWADGGATNLNNLAHLCPFHHRLIHEGGFSLRRDGGGLVFFAPSGERIPQAPRQPRGDCNVVTWANTRRGVKPSRLTLHPLDPNPRADLPGCVEGLLDSRRPRRE
jgi:hypothetical protein